MLLSLLLFSLQSASPAVGAGLPTAQSLPDVVVCIIDDVADSDIDAIQAKGWCSNLSEMAQQGVRYTRAYAHAKCAPSRDSFLYSRWLGLDRGDSCAAPVPGLSHSELDFSIAEMFDGAGYNTAAFGKWHTGVAAFGPFELAANLTGFDQTRQVVPVGPTCSDLSPQGQYRIDDGQGAVFQNDNTEALRDAFVQWWATTPSPKFAVVAFGSAHEPFKYPPASLLPPGYPTCGISCPNRKEFEAEIVGVDTALGQIRASVGPNGYVIFFGDNGTPGVVPGKPPEQTVATRPDQDPYRVKLSCYEDGVRVPLLISGPGIVPGTSQALVHVIDIFPTLATICRLKAPGLEGRSFAGTLVGGLGQRDHVFVWNTAPRLDRALIERKWKLLVREDGIEELYDLENDPQETTALPLQGDDYNRLKSKMEAITAGG